MEDRIECGRCKGAGLVRHDSYYTVDGVFRPAWTSNCHTCDGRGYFVKPDLKAILATIMSKRKPGHLVSKRPAGDREYLVWRMVRFHTGDDVTMPVTAPIGVHGDPYADQLYGLAELVAQRMTGKASSGRARWRSALHGEDPEPGLAASAYSGGPVVLDNNKPKGEQLELF